MFMEYRLPGQPWQLHPKHIPKTKWQVKRVNSHDFHYHKLLEIDVRRSYNMFGSLAGVRHGQPYIKPRGFPDTASPELTEAWTTDGEHTPSYLSVSEFIACIKHNYRAQHSVRKFKIRKNIKNIFENPRKNKEHKIPVDYVDVATYCRRFIKDNACSIIDGLIDIKPEVRIVFWFDS